MARGPFDTAGAFGRGSSGAPTPAGPVPASRIQAALARSVQELGGAIQAVADHAEGRAGQQEAARDAATGSLAIRNGLSVRDRVYDAAAREQLSAGLRSAYLDGLGQAEIANPDDPAAFGQALAAHNAAFDERLGPEMDAAVALDLREFMTLQSGASLGRVRQGEERRRVDVGQAAMLSSLETETRAFGQTVAGAGVDEAGAATVGLGFQRLVGQLARYGPREAFTVAGITFEADPTRLEVVDAETLARTALAAQSEGTSSWILNAQARLQGSEAQTTFAASMRERWAAGDAMFAGLDASSADRLLAQLDGQADRTRSDERSEQILAAQQAGNLMEAGSWGGEFDPDALRRLAAASGDPGLIAQAEWVISTGSYSRPGTGGGGGSGVGGGRYAGDVSLEGGFEAWADYFINWETGGGRTEQVVDSNGTISRFGINAAANPDLDIRNLSRSGAVQVLQRRYWNAIGADRLPPPLAFAAADAAAVAGVGRAQGWLQSSNGDVGRFLHLQEQHYRRLATENPGRYARYLPGWLARLNDTRQVTQRLQGAAVSRDGMASDPMRFAMGTSTRSALMGVPTLDLNGWRSPDTAGDFARALVGRRAAAATLADQYDAPVRLLTNGERQSLAQTFEAEPMAAVEFAQVAIASLGADEAGSLMREIGADGIRPALGLYLGELLSMERGQARSFVERAVRGIELRQDGMRAPSLPEGQTWEAAMQPFQSAFRNQPQRLQSARLAAEAAYVADAATGTPRDLQWYVRSALGAVRRDGRTFGGVATVNGSSVPVPPWLATRAMDEALDIMAVWWEDTGWGPRWANGEALRASEIAALRPVLLETGRYTLTRPNGEILQDRNGQPFSFDMDNTRDWLTPRLGADVNRRGP